MIIVKLMGGLGNQMFQYAAARRLAHFRKTDLRLDLSWFDSQSVRRYELNCFNIKETFVSGKDIAFFTEYPKTRIGRYLRKFKEWLIPLSRRKIVNEPHFHFAPVLLTLPRHSLLRGYWQSEKYFIDIEGIIRQEFTVKIPQVDKNKELAEQITSCESVSLHIRRGDYVSSPHTNQFHGSCDLNYYFRSVEHLTQTVKYPHFFIFSDDPEWARDNLKLSYPTTLVDHNSADKDYEDLRLMSQCKHLIIANSTFSWWGAWLNPNPYKIVYAPKKWFNTSQYDASDLIPKSWRRI